MEEKLIVNMTEQALFDFLLYHTYSKLAGFLTNVLGAAVIFMGIILVFMGKAEWMHLIFYILAGAAFLSYTPLQLKYRAKKQMQLNPEYKLSAEYTFADDGIHVFQDEKDTLYAWEQIQKVVATPKTLGYYYDAERALIVPKEAYGDKFMAVMKIVAAHVSREKVKIR